MIVEEFLKTYAEVLLHGSWLVVGIALVAGLLSSAICPFTVPVGLGVVGVVGTAESRARGSGFPIAMAFFAGLVLSLTALGALAGVLGFVATQAIGQWWMLIMAALAFVAALAVLAGPARCDGSAAARASWCLLLWIRLQSRHASRLPAPGAHRRRR